MAICLAGKTIQRVSIIDDDASARESYGDPIEELELDALLEEGPLADIDEILGDLIRKADALLCDYHLRMHNYAGFDGDKLVARCYQAQFPALLCTTYTDSDLTLMRSLRRFIPVLLKPPQIDPESIGRGFQLCIEEFAGRFRASRAPSRTLLRIEDVDDERGIVYAVLPGWNPKKKIRLNVDDLPEDLRPSVTPGKRFHARVNVGARSHEELYVAEWEPD